MCGFKPSEKGVNIMNIYGCTGYTEEYYEDIINHCLEAHFGNTHYQEIIKNTVFEDCILNNNLIKITSCEAGIFNIEFFTSDMKSRCLTYVDIHKLNR